MLTRFYCLKQRYSWNYTKNLWKAQKMNRRTLLHSFSFLIKTIPKIKKKSVYNKNAITYLLLFIKERLWKKYPNDWLICWAVFCDRSFCLFCLKFFRILVLHRAKEIMKIYNDFMIFTNISSIYKHFAGFSYQISTISPISTMTWWILAILSGRIARFNQRLTSEQIWMYA